MRSATEMSTLRIAAGHPSARAATGVLRDLSDVVDGLLTCLVAWNRRAIERRALRRLDDHLLRDIGLDRARMEEMAARPFWRA